LLPISPQANHEFPADCSRRARARHIRVSAPPIVANIPTEKNLYGLPSIKPERIFRHAPAFAAYANNTLYKLPDLGQRLMWTSKIQPLDAGRAQKFSLHNQASPISYIEAIEGWQNSSDFRDFFIRLLSDAPFSAFRWETPPITSATAGRSFEFVLHDSPGLAQHPDENAFAEHFRCAGNNDVVEFSNLGKDAILIVPCPKSLPSTYGHLALFVRGAPDSQKHALWQLVGDAMTRRLSAKPVWLSTAGAGVSWLHIRLDDRPKYYGHAPYRSLPT
jgi:hypothetical protein